MEAAARHRYLDGLLLATSDRERLTGAMYLLGYVAEILVKTAYYRLRGVRPFDDVADELHGMRNRARTLGFPWQGNWHNLESLAGLLVVERAATGSPMEPLFAAEFQARAASVGGHWSEILRYKEAATFESELDEVFESVEWLVANHAQLWS